jgi:hypothetical protein
MRAAKVAKPRVKHGATIVCRLRQQAPRPPWVISKHSTRFLQVSGLAGNTFAIRVCRACLRGGREGNRRLTDLVHFC